MEGDIPPAAAVMNTLFASDSVFASDSGNTNTEHHAGGLLGGEADPDIGWLASTDFSLAHIGSNVGADAEIATTTPEELMLGEEEGEDGDWVLVGNAGLDTLLDGEESEVLKKLARIVGNIELRMEWGSQTQVRVEFAFVRNNCCCCCYTDVIMFTTTTSLSSLCSQPPPPHPIIRST